MQGAVEKFSEGIVFIQMKDKESETAERLMIKVRDKLQTFSQFDFQAGIGYLVDDLKKLPQCYQSAVQALDYSNIYGRNHVTVIDNVLVLEEKEPVHLEKEIADVVHFSNMEGILDIRHAIGNYMNRLLIASKGSFFLYSKRMYKAVVRGSNLITGNSVECGRVLQRGSLCCFTSLSGAFGNAEHFA